MTNIHHYILNKFVDIVPPWLVQISKTNSYGSIVGVSQWGVTDSQENQWECDRKRNVSSRSLRLVTTDRKSINIPSPEFLHSSSLTRLIKVNL